MAGRGLSLFRNERPWYSFQNEMRNLLDRFNDDWELTPSNFPATMGQFAPNVDVTDRGDSYLVTAEVPGMSEKDINISLDQNVLTLEGEKKLESEEKQKGYYRSEISYGNFYRTIPFNEEIDESKVQASYRDGMLKITLGKKEGRHSKRKKIEINTQKQIQ